MKSMQIAIKSELKLDIQLIRDRIGDLPKILKTIEKNNGGRTKYRGAIFNLYIFVGLKKSFYLLSLCFISLH